MPLLSFFSLPPKSLSASSATFGVRPKRRTCSAMPIVMSAISDAVGFWLNYRLFSFGFHYMAGSTHCRHCGKFLLPGTISRAGSLWPVIAAGPAKRLARA